jgi:hypothetical protein
MYILNFKTYPLVYVICDDWTTPKLSAGCGEKPGHPTLAAALDVTPTGRFLTANGHSVAIGSTSEGQFCKFIQCMLGILWHMCLYPESLVHKSKSN